MGLTLCGTKDTTLQRNEVQQILTTTNDPQIWLVIPLCPLCGRYRFPKWPRSSHLSTYNIIKLHHVRDYLLPAKRERPHLANLPAGSIWRVSDAWWVWNMCKTFLVTPFQVARTSCAFNFKMKAERNYV